MTGQETCLHEIFDQHDRLGNLSLRDLTILIECYPHLQGRAKRGNRPTFLLPE